MTRLTKIQQCLDRTLTGRCGRDDYHTPFDVRIVANDDVTRGRVYWKQRNGINHRTENHEQSFRVVHESEVSVILSYGGTR